MDEARGTLFWNICKILEARRPAVVLLENKSVASTGQPLLPFAPKGKKIYLYGVAAKVAEAVGFLVVTDPAQADLAIIRAPAP